MGADEQIYRVVIGGVRQNPAAYAVIDKATKMIRMDDATRALAIFDTREAARHVSKLLGDTRVVPITMRRVKRDGSV
jgi:hypothetical protein